MKYTGDSNFRGNIKILFVLLLILCSTVGIKAQQLDMDKLQGLKARSIGPAGMSGRVTAIDVVLSDPQTIYVGTASGGLWKSTSGGTLWQPIFDDQPVASIGALAIDQRIPDLIWVGTGEGNPRNSQTSGNGIYKSLDGGKSWQHMGLENTRNIHRVIIDPYNSDIVYAAAQGAAWGQSPDRGIYKTTDGGKTWNKILYVNEKTGAADLVIDPNNPNKLIAAMWEYRRWPWFFKSGGEGSGMYVSFDAGKTWTKRTDKDGLPSGELGRIGLAIAASNSNVIYALVESKKTALYRSNDGGFKWSKVSDKNIGDRPFYYADIFVDPQNEDRIYSLYSRVNVSNDGGKNFETLIGYNKVHPDHHAWWINPNDPENLIDGNDGGLAISHDRGKTWRFIENLPLGQFYHINVDNQTPYNIYGGMQDNGSWRGPAYIWQSGGILNTYWEGLGGGDGFDVLPSAANNRYVFSMYQGGNLSRFDTETGYAKYIKPVHPDDFPLRFNWNAAIAGDPFDGNTIYYGSQFLHKSTNNGDSWEIISPDLTTNDPAKQKQYESGGLSYDQSAAENYTTIVSISASPVKEGIIWVGTDDGNVQLTRNAGKTWTNFAEEIDDAPSGGWVTQVHASLFDPAEAFVVIDNHRKDDWQPYLFRTKDYGESWARLTNDNVWGYTLSFVQDPVEPKLYFLGTEFGLYVSIDEGENWTKWTNGYPTVSTMDLAIQPCENDLVIGTFGRSAYIIDNISPLRQLVKENNLLSNTSLELFEIPDAIQASYKSLPGMWSPADAGFEGENREYGAMITYLLNPELFADSIETDCDSVKIEIFNSENELVRTLLKSPKEGINRTYWALNRDGFRFPGRPKFKPDKQKPNGPPVVPGNYKVKVTYKNVSDSADVKVTFDPRIEIAIDDLKAKDETTKTMMKDFEISAEAYDRLEDALKTISAINARIKDKEDDSLDELEKNGTALNDSIKVLKELFVEPEVQGFRQDPTRVLMRMFTPYRYLQASFDEPGENVKLTWDVAKQSLSDAVNKVNQFFNKDWKEYQSAVQEANITYFDEYIPIELE